MKKLKIKAYAKINLVLNILNKKKDGYHNIESIFQQISLHDNLCIKKKNDEFFLLKTNNKEIDNKDNLIYKAYLILKKDYSCIKGIEVILKKKIPIQAGLGGGSSDCASFIFGMQKLYNLEMTEKYRNKIGKKLGADVVPFFYGNTLKLNGIGDIITEIDTEVKYYTIIIKPNFTCSTIEMYRKIDKKEIKDKVDIFKMITALKKGDIKEVSDNLYNIFEYVIEEKEELNIIKKDLINVGAINTLLCGSGSCVLGIFKNKKLAKRGYQKLKYKYEAYLSKTR